ncbi:MAG TPA: hypothetical protein VG408_06295 [Actinomycetota bacterium]|nr:hypothetical protein [Actinomycetota bacterium]
MIGIVSKRLLCVSLVVAVLSGMPVASRAQTPPDCTGENANTPEVFGPTDISAVSGNGTMSVALNEDATVTVLRWPSPSFYDQIKYRTTDRTARFMGALPNEGALIGIAWKGRDAKWTFDWLRQWSSSQRYADDDGDQIITTFIKRTRGLRVTVSDVVASDLDVLARSISVERKRRSQVRAVRVIGFANFNPVFSKTPQSPTDDWCTEENNDSGGEYAPRFDAVVHEREGVDVSTGETSGAAVAMGFGANSQAHHVGVDTYQTGADGNSAYDDAADGKLSGRDEAPGQADAAISDQLSLKKRSATTTLYIAAGFTRGEALGALDTARGEGPVSIRTSKARWWQRWLEDAALPKDAPRDVTRVAKRSLVSMRQAIDPRRDMIVASIATQPPNSVDWIRDGAYINRALELAGQASTVADHNVRYGRLQVTATNPPNGHPGPVPPGNWSQNYYADGVVGGPIPYEIDATGFGIWTLWDHFDQTQDRAYLTQAPIYEPIQRAAHYLSDPPPLGCIDTTSNLQCVANEEDNPTPSQSLVGAQAVWMGLGAAVQAAETFGRDGDLVNAEKWRARQAELGAAIDAQFLDEECNCYTRDYITGATLLWPVHLLPYTDPRAQAQADVNWQHMTDVLSGEIRVGREESRLAVAHAFAWSGTSKLSLVKRALTWIAQVPTTDETGLLGEAWMVFEPNRDHIETMLGQPHVTSHAQYYIAAIKAYGKAPYRF